MTKNNLEERLALARKRYQHLASVYEQTGNKHDRKSAVAAFWAWQSLASALCRWEESLNEN